MKFLLLTPLIFLLSSPIKAEDNNAKHDKCLQAADYEGCMDFQTNQKKSSISASAKDCSKKICFKNEVTQSTDNLGMKIIKGWNFTENPAKRIAYYWDPAIYKINSGGNVGRFFHQRAVIRYFTKGTSGTSGYFSSSGTQTIDCNESLYGKINCTSSSPKINYVPGSPEIPPQVKQVRIDVIYDCEDSTVATYHDYKIQKVKGLNGKKNKWLSAENLPDRPRYGLFKYQNETMKNTVCPDKGANPKVDFSDLYQFRDKGIRKRGSSNKKNVGNINCDSPVWKNKPRCNY